MGIAINVGGGMVDIFLVLMVLICAAFLFAIVLGVCVAIAIKSYFLCQNFLDL